MARLRGVVIENSNGGAIIMAPDGELKKIRTGESLLVGDIYEQPASYTRYVAVAAIFLLLLVGTVDFFAVKAYARVSNGVELGLNRWERIVSVQATNAVGEQVVSKLNLKGQKIDTAVQAVVQESVEINSDQEVSICLKSIQGKNAKNEEKVLTAISSKLANQSNKSASKQKIIKSNNKIIINPASADSDSAKKPKKDKPEKNNRIDKGNTNKPDSSAGKNNQQPPGKVKNENQIKVPVADKKPQSIKKEPPGQSIKKETSNKGNQQKVIKEKKNSPSANSDKKIKSQKTNNNKPAKGKSENKEKVKK